MKLSKSKIKEAMDKKGISTYTKLAETLGITKNQISVMLSDEYDPLKTRVVELCKCLDVNPFSVMECQPEEYGGKNLFAITPETVRDDAVTAIELFAGAGGIALGLEKAGIETFEYVEFDRTCCDTLRYNRPCWNVVCDDIHHVSFEEYRNKVDIVTGGFPCQAFSFAGKKLGFEDTRGTLFHEFARCVKEVNPKIFMAENVRGLVFHDHGRTLETILDVLGSLGYRVQWKILNAAYFGVGQKRERIVIIGIRDDLDVEFEYPKPEKCMTTLREALKNCPKSAGQEYSEKKKSVLKLVPAGGCWVNLPDEIAKEYMGKSYYSGGGRRGMARRISWDEPCLTLTCSPSQKQTERCHPDETRPFTVREYARIQSFPDTWNFCGGIGEQYKQIGNAVPVELARRLGVQLKKAILESRKEKQIIGYASKYLQQAL